MLDGDLYGAQDVIKRRSNDIGNKLKLIFWYAIIGLALAAVVVVAGVAAAAAAYTAALGGTAGTAALGGTMGLLAIVSIAIFAIGIAYTVTLFGLAAYNDAFKTAAILYLIKTIVSVLKNFVPSSGFLGLVISLAELGLDLGFIVYFSNGMVESVRFVDGVLASQWESFKNVYLILSFIAIGSALLTIIPVIGLLGALASTLSGLGLIGLAIWELVLIWKSAVRLQNY